MTRHETTGADVAKIAGKVLRNRGKATPEEASRLAASVLTQVEDAPPEPPEDQPGEQPPAREVPNTPDKHESVRAVKGQEPRA